MIVVLVGDEGAKALADLGEASEVHAVGFDPRGLTGRPVAVHTRPEAEVAQSVAADKVIGGNPALWPSSLDRKPPDPEAYDALAKAVVREGIDVLAVVAAPPKRRGRPPKVK